MRGKASPYTAIAFSCGITPAYAGKRTDTGEFSAACGDHPRVCGEKLFVGRRCGCPSGSPPRMRGKGSRLNRVRLACRITPAYAGKSTVQGRNAYHGQDHPRVCGEKALPASWRLPVPGSPPRMRGKADFDVCSDRQCGITPAYAGKSLARRCVVPRSRDHPRVCGEKAGAQGVVEYP